MQKDLDPINDTVLFEMKVIHCTKLQATFVPGKIYFLVLHFSMAGKHGLEILPLAYNHNLELFINSEKKHIRKKLRYMQSLSVSTKLGYHSVNFKHKLMYRYMS